MVHNILRCDSCIIYTTYERQISNTVGTNKLTLVIKYENVFYSNIFLVNMDQVYAAKHKKKSNGPRQFKSPVTNQTKQSRPVRISQIPNRVEQSVLAEHCDNSKERDFYGSSSRRSF